jgi:hypothetical protein
MTRALIIALVFVGFATAAPAPKAKNNLPKPKIAWVSSLDNTHMFGQWKMFWHGNNTNPYEMTLSKNGEYIAVSSHVTYIGYWAFNQASNVLYVQEVTISTVMNVENVPWDWGEYCIQFQRNKKGLFNPKILDGLFLNRDGRLSEHTFRQVRK